MRIHCLCWFFCRNASKLSTSQLFFILSMHKYFTIGTEWARAFTWPWLFLWWIFVRLGCLFIFFLPSFACEAINFYSSFFGIRYVANVYYFAEYFQILSDKSLRRTAQQCKCSACLKKTHTTQHYDYKKIEIMTKCCAK